MGYTHYWYQKKSFTNEEWEHIQYFADRLTKSMEAQKTLGIEKKQSDHVRVTDRNIVFNGKQKYNLDHETFCLEKDMILSEHDDPSKGAFNFCKTANKPYDKFVTAVLLIAHNIAPDTITLKSDGWRDEWEGGVKLVYDKLESRVFIPDTIKPRPDDRLPKLVEELKSMGKLEIIDARE